MHPGFDRRGRRVRDRKYQAIDWRHLDVVARWSGNGSVWNALWHFKPSWPARAKRRWPPFSIVRRECQDRIPRYGVRLSEFGSSDWSASAPSSKLKIITKTAPIESARIERSDKARILDAVALSMERLRVDRLYGLLVHHATDLGKPGWEHLVDVLARGVTVAGLGRVSVGARRSIVTTNWNWSRIASPRYHPGPQFNRRRHAIDIVEMLLASEGERN